MHKWIMEDLVNVAITDEQFRLFGRKSKWGGIEASNLCRVFIGSHVWLIIIGFNKRVFHGKMDEDFMGRQLHFIG